MKYIMICCILFLTSCRFTDSADNFVPQQDDGIKMYIGKVMLSDSGILILRSAVDDKLLKVDVLTGCECDSEIGNRSGTPAPKDKSEKNTKEQKDSTIKEMYIGGTLLYQLQHMPTVLLQHIYVEYASISNMPIIFKIRNPDLFDKTPLEKLTVYTSEKFDPVNQSNSTPTKIDSVKKSLPDSIVSKNIKDTVKGKDTNSAPITKHLSGKKN